MPSRLQLPDQPLQCMQEGWGGGHQPTDTDVRCHQGNVRDLASYLLTRLTSPCVSLVMLMPPQPSLVPAHLVQLASVAKLSSPRVVRPHRLVYGSAGVASHPLLHGGRNLQQMYLLQITGHRLQRTTANPLSLPEKLILQHVGQKLYHRPGRDLNRSRYQ